MSFAAALLAMAIGGTTPPQAASPDSPIRFQIRVLELKGLSWRTEFHHDLRPVTRQGNASVWTVDRESAAKLVQVAGGVLQGPTIAAASEARATVSQEKAVHFVGAVRRVSDGPPFEGTHVAFHPEIDRVDVGLKVDVRGRKLDQGVLSNVTLHDRRVIAVHTVAAHDGVHQKPGNVCCSSTEIEISLESPMLERAAKKLAGSLGLTASKPCEVTTITGQYQVPEVVESRVEGEWLIPADGCLAIGLGVHTTTGEKGEAVVTERVALIQAEPLGVTASAPTAGRRALSTPPPIDGQVARTTAVLPTPVVIPTTPAHIRLNSFTVVPMGDAPGAPMPSPATPSRTLPQGFDPSGLPAPLPPLPDPEVEPTSTDGAALPSPQARHQPGSASLDFSLTRTTNSGELAVSLMGRVPQEPGPIGVFDARVKLDATKLARMKTETYTIPLGNHLSLELKARIVPRARAEEATDESSAGTCPGEGECEATESK